MLGNYSTTKLYSKSMTLDFIFETHFLKVVRASLLLENDIL